MNPKQWKPKNPALAIRTCDKEMRSHGGFQWPREIGAIVEAPDWNPSAECGNGLHGLLDGQGDYGLTSCENDAHWLVIEIDRDECVDLGGKVKSPRCVVRHIGNMASAMTLVSARWVDEEIKRSAQNISSGDGSSAASSGYASRAASSGNYSRAASSGDGSRAASSGGGSSAASSGKGSSAASSGNGSSAASSSYASRAASSGYGSRAASSGSGSSAASSGYASRAASSGDGSRAASSGNYSRAGSSGDGSRAASSGDGSSAASSGYGSSAASSGNYSRAASEGEMTVAMVAGLYGRAKAGVGGAFALAWRRDTEKQMRIAVGTVGENGIKPDTWYRVSAAGALEECK